MGIEKGAPVAGAGVPAGSAQIEETQSQQKQQQHKQQKREVHVEGDKVRHICYSLSGELIGYYLSRARRPGVLLCEKPFGCTYCV